MNLGFSQSCSVLIIYYERNVFSLFFFRVSCSLHARFSLYNVFKHAKTWKHIFLQVAKLGWSGASLSFFIIIEISIHVPRMESLTILLQYSSSGYSQEWKLSPEWSSASASTRRQWVRTTLLNSWRSKVAAFQFSIVILTSFVTPIVEVLR